MTKNVPVIVHFVNQLTVGGCEEIIRVSEKYLPLEHISYCFAMSEDAMGDELRKVGTNVIIQPLKTNIDFCEQLQPDVIMLHTAGYIPAELNPLKEKCPKAKICLLIHSPQTLTIVPDSIDVVICVSEIVYDMQTSPKRLLIKNGIDIDEIKKIQVPDEVYKKYGLTGRELVIGRLSRIAPDKLTSDFIIAAQKISNKYDNIKFMIVGESKENLHPGYLKDIKELVSQLGLKDKIIFTGVQRDRGLYLSMMHILMNPSINESFGCVFSEAMCAELPVVTYNYHGNKETVINDFNGYCVEGRNIEELANKTIELALDKEKRTLFGKNGRKFVEENCNGKTMAEKYAKLYTTLLRS
jgi:glycosyltransferase involved in cell wall biosynthesis